MVNVSKNFQALLLLQVILKLIKEELDKYSADRLGKFDFALHSAGKINIVKLIAHQPKHGM